MKDKIDFVDEMEREVALHLTVVMLLLLSVVVAFAWGDACAAWAQPRQAGVSDGAIVC